MSKFVSQLLPKLQTNSQREYRRVADNTDDGTSTLDEDESSPYYPSISHLPPQYSRNSLNSLFGRQNDAHQTRILLAKQKKKRRMIVLSILILICSFSIVLAAVFVKKPNSDSMDLFRGDRVLVPIDGHWSSGVVVQGDKVMKVRLYKEKPQLDFIVQFFHQQIVFLVPEKLQYYRVAAYDGSKIKIDWSFFSIYGNDIGLCFTIVEGIDAFNQFKNRRLGFKDKHIKFNRINVRDRGTFQFNTKNSNNDASERSIYFIIFSITHLPFDQDYIQGSIKYTVSLKTYDVQSIQPTQTCDKVPCEFAIPSAKRYLLIEGPKASFDGEPGNVYFEEYPRKTPYLALFGSLSSLLLIFVFGFSCVYLKKSSREYERRCQNIIYPGIKSQSVIHHPSNTFQNEIHSSDLQPIIGQETQKEQFQ